MGRSTRAVGEKFLCCFQAQFWVDLVCRVLGGGEQLVQQGARLMNRVCCHQTLRAAPSHPVCPLKVARSLATRYWLLVFNVSLKTVVLGGKPLTKPDGHSRSRSAGISLTPLSSRSIIDPRLPPHPVTPAWRKLTWSVCRPRFHSPEILRQLTVDLTF